MFLRNRSIKDYFQINCNKVFPQFGEMAAGKLMVQDPVAFPQDGFDGKRVRWKLRHCFVFPQRFRWLKRVSSFPFCFRKRFCTEIFCILILGFSNNKICFNCTEYTLQSCKMRNHCIDPRICERTEIIACAELHVVNTGIVIDDSLCHPYLRWFPGFALRISYCA